MNLSIICIILAFSWPWSKAEKAQKPAVVDDNVPAAEASVKVDVDKMIAVETEKAVKAAAAGAAAGAAAATAADRSGSEVSLLSEQNTP